MANDGGTGTEVLKYLAILINRLCWLGSTILFLPCLRVLLTPFDCTRYPDWNNRTEATYLWDPTLGETDGGFVSGSTYGEVAHETHLLGFIALFAAAGAAWRTPAPFPPP